jgi:hypothetical protein
MVFLDFIEGFLAFNAVHDFPFLGHCSIIKPRTIILIYIINAISQSANDSSRAK